MFKPMFNKKVGNSNITLFCKYGRVDLTTSNTDDTAFNETYGKYYLPMYIENVVFGGLNALQVEKGAKGDYSCTIDLTGKTSNIYRIIDGVKYKLKYLESRVYDGMPYDEQLRKYFTIRKGYFVTNKIIDNLPHEILVTEITASKGNVFAKNLAEKYDIDSVDESNKQLVITFLGTKQQS